MATSPSFDYGQFFSPAGAPWMTPQQQNPASVYNITNTGDPGTQATQDRLYESAWGEQQQGYNANQENYYNANQGQYANAANVEGANIGDTPGYTPSEMANILQTQQLQSGETTPQGYAALAPTADQSAAMAGNPGSFLNYYNPSTITGPMDTYNAAETGDYSNAVTGLGGALNTQSTADASALNPASLTVAPSFLSSVENAYTGAASNINTDVNSSKLNLNLDPSTYLMSPKELQDIQTQAGQAVQTQTAAQNQAYEHAAAASGNADPMAVAALEQQNRAQGDEAGANAETSAYLAATGEQRQLENTLATEQLGAGQTQTQFQVGAGENLLGQQLGEANTYEGMNLGANQTYAGMQLTTAQQQEAAAAAAQEYEGSTGIGMEAAQQSANAANQEYLQSTGEGLSQNINTASTAAGTQAYNIGLQNQMYQQQNQFNQNTAVTQNQQQAYQAAANARVAGQNTFLNWSTGQANASTQASLGYGQQNNQAAATTFGGMNASANTATNWGLGLNQTTGVRGFATDFNQIMGGLSGGARGASAVNDSFYG